MVKFSVYLNRRILSGNEYLTKTKDHNFVVNLRKLTCNNPNPDLVKVNAQAKFDQIPFICIEDIERKRISTITKGHNSCQFGKKACNNPNLDLVKVKTDANFHQFFHKILCGKEIWTITKSHNYVINMRKLTRKKSQSGQRQCMCKIWSNFMNSFSR